MSPYVPLVVSAWQARGAAVHEVPLRDAGVPMGPLTDLWDGLSPGTVIAAVAVLLILPVWWPTPKDEDEE